MDDRSPPNPKARWMYVQFALTIATVEDRIVQTAMKRVMEPIFEAEFQECSYGYRPRRNAKQASEAIRQDLYQRSMPVDINLVESPRWLAWRFVSAYIHRSIPEIPLQRWAP